LVRIFVSHASDDRSVAGRIHRLLAESGHEVSLDVDRNDGIRGGENWKRRLYMELRGADAVVCVVSSSYVASQWCAIEVAVAQALGTRLVPLSVEPRTRHPLLGDTQHLDYPADLADELLVAASGRHRRRRLLLVVDQFEETPTRASRDRRGGLALRSTP
jgi:TIR domain